MPIYDYKCQHCEDTFEVEKRIAFADEIESCPHCSAACDKKCRLITNGKEFYGEKVEEPFYSVALGKWVKGNRDNRQQAKERGMIEVGNEDFNKIYETTERDRNKMLNGRWDKIFDSGPYQIRGR